jgi:tRNA pseudouridine38-40 synthase
MLPTSIHVRKISKVNENFHARYDATARVYRYLIKVGESNPFEADFITFMPTCNFEKIAKNIKIFEGEHNFSYFIKTGSDEKSPVRKIYKAFAYKYKDIIVLHFKANGFLRSQIRFMVASLLNLDANQIEAKLTCKYNYTVKPAQPNGLYLAKIHYKKDNYV